MESEKGESTKWDGIRNFLMGNEKRMHLNDGKRKGKD